MTDLHVVPRFGGEQYGTVDNPFTARDSYEFDALMRAHAEQDTINWKLEDGALFHSAGTREWEDSNDVQANPGFRAGKHWTFEGAATLKLDVAAIPDERISPTPINLIISTEARFDKARLNLHTPQEAWDALPRGQAVRGLSFDLSYTEMVDRWRAAGQILRVGAVHLAGHQAAVEHIHITNCGAWGYEGFPVAISGGIGMYDRNLIAQLDPATHILDDGIPQEDCSHIVDVTYDGYPAADTNNQVSVNAIWGSIGERTPGEWIHHLRRWCYQRDCKTLPGGDPNTNSVQGHTIYGSIGGRISHNYSKGAKVLAYGDFFQTHGLETIDNVADDCRYIVQYLLSPTALGMGNAADYFHRSGDLIARNRSATGDIMLDTLGAPTADRYIKGVRLVDNTVPYFQNTGAEIVERHGNSFDPAASQDPELHKRSGCRLFGG